MDFYYFLFNSPNMVNTSPGKTKNGVKAVDTLR
jgi:hypothetical protein